MAGVRVSEVDVDRRTGALEKIELYAADDGSGAGSVGDGTGSGGHGSDD